MRLPKYSMISLAIGLNRGYLFSRGSIFWFALAIVGTHSVLVQDNSEHICIY